MSYGSYQYRRQFSFDPYGERPEAYLLPAPGRQTPQGAAVPNPDGTYFRYNNNQSRNDAIASRVRNLTRGRVDPSVTEGNAHENGSFMSNWNNLPSELQHMVINRTNHVGNFLRWLITSADNVTLLRWIQIFWRSGRSRVRERTLLVRELRRRNSRFASRALDWLGRLTEYGRSLARARRRRRR